MRFGRLFFCRQESCSRSASLYVPVILHCSTMPTANFSLWFWVAFGVAANAFCPDRSPLTPPRAPFAVLSKWRQSTTASVDSTSKPCRYRKSLRMSSTSALPRIQPSHLEELAEKGYTVIQNFLPDDLQSSLRQDVSRLRQKGMFKVAKIGQDSTNTLNEDIRVAETCFIGANKLQDVSSDSRSRLYTLLGQVRDDLSGNAILNTDNAVTKGTPPLDGNLDELLYVYYPQGGFYRRHLDSVGQSASVLRCYSLLLYLNEDWKPINGGQLRLYP
jgi:SM-20-related protein